MKKFHSKVFKKFKLLFSIPHFWLAAIILFLALCSLFISRHYLITQPFLSSMFLNLFAGLITGLIITFLSGVKFISKYRCQTKLNWFKKIDELIVAHLRQKRIMIGKLTGENEDFFNAAYDSSATMKYVNEHIISSVFDIALNFKPIKLLYNRFDFDLLTVEKKLESLRSYIIINAEQPQKRRAVVDEINNVSGLYSSLRDKVNNEINLLQLKLDLINRSIV